MNGSSAYADLKINIKYQFFNYIKKSRFMTWIFYAYD